MKKLTLIVFVLSIMTSLSAQQLLNPSVSFSKKKTSYITLEDGTEIKGMLTDIDYKKGLIKLIKIKDEAGTKHKLKPNSVKFMYLLPSGLGKFLKAADFLQDAERWSDEKLNNDFLNQGYVYFETTDVKIKKKTKPMLMQLLNPTFSKNIKVYNDPIAKQTLSVGATGVSHSGLAKSYYIKFDTDNAAYKIEKSKYEKSFPELWSKCDNLSKLTEIQWKDFTDHIIKYTECNK